MIPARIPPLHESEVMVIDCGWQGAKRGSEGMLSLFNCLCKCEKTLGL